MVEGSIDQMPIERILGGNLRRLRLQYKMTPEAVADRIRHVRTDITAEDILDYELGKKRAIPNELAELSQIFNVGIDEFFRITGIGANDNTPQT